MSSNSGGDTPAENERREEESVQEEEEHAGQPEVNLEAGAASREVAVAGLPSPRAALQGPEMRWLVDHIRTTFGGQVEDTQDLREALAQEILRELVPILARPAPAGTQVEAMLEFFNVRYRIGRPFASFQSDTKRLLNGPIETNYEPLGPPEKNRRSGLIHNKLGVDVNDELADIAEYGWDPQDSEGGAPLEERNGYSLELGNILEDMAENLLWTVDGSGEDDVSLYFVLDRHCCYHTIVPHYFACYFHRK